MGSHTDAPAWQGFEARMRDRRAARLRQQAKKRRRRVATASGFLAAVAIVGGAWVFPQFPLSLVPEASPSPVPRPAERAPEPPPAGEPETERLAATEIPSAPLASYPLAAPDAIGDVVAMLPQTRVQALITPAPASTEPVDSKKKDDGKAVAPAPTATLARDIPPVAPRIQPTTEVVEPEAPKAEPSRAETDVAPASIDRTEIPAEPAVVPAAPVAEPPAPEVAPPPAPPRARSFDSGAVREVVEEYRRAYERLDAKAAASIWPTVDVAALARAFNGLSSQHLEYERCVVSGNGDEARVWCKGRAAYAPKVGRPWSAPREWLFQVRRDADVWRIESTETK
ncbi:MAG TPA: hypothetical protein VHJ77_06565 [Vicinamibacterales bacterium]|jgi:hypothetical protein|nr:hypothetical protein [Vicinamibacterales bacterium]